MLISLLFFTAELYQREQSTYYIHFFSFHSLLNSLDFTHTFLLSLCVKVTKKLHVAKSSVTSLLDPEVITTQVICWKYSDLLLLYSSFHSTFLTVPCQSLFLTSSLLNISGPRPILSYPFS